MHESSDRPNPISPNSQSLTSEPTPPVRIVAMLLEMTPTGVVKACRRHGIGREIKCRASRSAEAPRRSPRAKSPGL